MSAQSMAGNGQDRNVRPVAQHSPIVTFLHPSGEPVTWGEFDRSFLRASGIGPSSWERPVRVEIVAQQSKRGNTFFSYEQGGIPLPDGLETELRIGDLTLRADEVGKSKQGNPTRQYHGTLTIDGVQYEVLGYVVKTRSPYWVKVHVQKVVRGGGSAAEPRGGKFV